MATNTKTDVPTTDEAVEDPTLDITAEEFEITSGDDLFQSGEKEGFNDEYEYALTAFVPACVTSKDAKTAPAGAALWIIPDITDVQYLRTLKIFKMTWMEKIPASYNTLYIRVDRDDNPNPTTLQKMIIDSTISRYTDKDGVPNLSQTVIIPIINLYDGKPIVTLGEMSNACYKALVKFDADADDNTDGLVSTRRRPIYLWREGKGQKTTYGFRFYKGTEHDMKKLLAEAGDMMAPREYVKTRAVATERWFASRYAKYQAGELESGEENTTDTEAYIDMVMELPTPILKSVLDDAGLDIAGLRTKQALIDLATAHEELLTDAIKAAQPKATESE